MIKVYCKIDGKLAMFGVEAESYTEAIELVKSETKCERALALVETEVELLKV